MELKLKSEDLEAAFQAAVLNMISEEQRAEIFEAAVKAMMEPPKHTGLVRGVKAKSAVQMAAEDAMRATLYRTFNELLEKDVWKTKLLDICTQALESVA